MKLIATLPLLPRYRYDISRHPLVDELRYNTVMPLDVDISTAVRQLAQVAGDRPLWLDLKARQLRITKFAYLPYDYVELSHAISVDLPARLHFKDCTAVIESIVDGNKLILAERPLRTVGAGEPVNILEPSLSIQGFLTPRDREFIEAAMNEGLHRYMLSFVEKKEDIEELLALDPQAMIMAKIESRKGLDFVRDHGPFDGPVTLMAARDDLFINMGDSRMEILKALELILAMDAHAVAASRLLTSLYEDPAVSMGDISDLHMLTMMGYGSFMLSDEICRIRDVFRRVIETYRSYCDYRGDGGAGG